jgi:hypothetical protein
LLTRTATIDRPRREDVDRSRSSFSRAFSPGRSRGGSSRVVASGDDRKMGNWRRIAIALKEGARDDP